MRTDDTTEMSVFHGLCLPVKPEPRDAEANYDLNPKP